MRTVKQENMGLGLDNETLLQTERVEKRCAEEMRICALSVWLSVMVVSILLILLSDTMTVWTFIGISLGPAILCPIFYYVICRIWKAIESKIETE